MHSAGGAAEWGMRWWCAPGEHVGGGVEAVLAAGYALGAHGKLVAAAVVHCECELDVDGLALGVGGCGRQQGAGGMPLVNSSLGFNTRLMTECRSSLSGHHGDKEKKTSLPPVNWRWVEEGDGYVGRLQPHGQPLGVGRQGIRSCAC